MANAIRALSMDAVEKAKSGHPGMPMGMADVATALFTRFLKFDPAQPTWADRDRFVLSAGHGSMLLYSLLHLTGYADMTLEELKQFRQLGARTAGHPEFGHAGGVETTTGPLGQGIANAVGMALAEKMLAARFGADLVDHRTWVIAGDGCLMEGVSHEAISLAGHLKLNKLIVLWDDNQISIDGSTDLTVSDDQHARFRASGWTTLTCDGHDPAAIVAAMEAALTSDKPVMIACRTTIGFGAPNKGGTSGAHGSPLGGDEIAKVRVALDWPHAPFEIPADLMARWRAAGSRGAPLAAAWAKRLAADPRQGEFTRMMTGAAPAALADAFAKVKADLAAMPKVETRRAGADRRLGRPDRLQPDQGEIRQADLGRGFLRPLRLLGRARAWHGRSHERHGAAWRLHAVRRHLPGVHGLLPTLDPPCGADGPQGRLCHDP